MRAQWTGQVACRGPLCPAREAAGGHPGSVLVRCPAGAARTVALRKPSNTDEHPRSHFVSLGENLPNMGRKLCIELSVAAMPLGGSLSLATKERVAGTALCHSPPKEHKF